MTICNTQPPTPPQTPKMPGSRTAARVRGWFNELADRAGVLGTKSTIELALQREYAIMATNLAHIPLLKNFNKTESWMAANLGWKSWLWQVFHGEMTDAGAVRYALQDRARTMSNLIKQAAAYKALPEIRQLYETLHKAIPDIDDWALQEILYDHIVVGQFPKLQNVMDSPVVKFQLEARYTQHITRLAELGVTTDQVKALDNLAGSISSHLDNLRQLGAEAGLDIAVMRNGGYLPLQADELWGRHLSKLSESAAIGKSRGGFLDKAEFLRRSRASNVPILLDVDRAAELLNMPPMKLLGLAGEPGEISKLLNDTLSPEQMDKLFDSGILAQIPAMSDELTEFFRDGLDLPVANLAEAIMLDPVKAVSHYAQQLSDAAKNSTLFKTLFTDGISAQWLVDAASVTPEMAKDYVRLGSDQMIADFISSSGLREELGDMMMHRTVQSQLKSLLALNTNWADQSALARYFQQFTSTFRKSSILASGLSYVKRVVTQNAVSLHAMTGDLSQLGIANVEYHRVLSRGLESLDDSKVFAKVGGQDYTLRQLFESTFVKRATENISGTEEGVQVATSVLPGSDNFMAYFRKLNPDSMKRFFQVQMDYNKRFGSPFTGAKFDSLQKLVKDEIIGGGLETAYKQMAIANQMLDFSTRWAAVRTLATQKSKSFSDFDALLRYTDEYLGIQEDVGSIGRLYGQIGRPFASFAMAAPGSALRHTLLNPWRAANMGVLYAQASAATDLTDEEMAQWQKDSTVISLFEHNGKRYGIAPGTVDFYQDSFNYFKELAEDVGRAFGAPVGTTKEQVEQELQPSKPIWDALLELASNTYIAEFFPVIGIDPNTLESYVDPDSDDTLLGFPTTRRIRDIFTGTMPLLRTLDRYAPSEIVGTPEQRNAGTLAVETPGEPGWLGFTPRYGGNKKTLSPNPLRKQELVAWLLSSVGGLSLVEIDPQKNLIRNYNDFDTTVRELGTAIGSANKRLMTEQTLTPVQKRQLVENIQSMQKLRFFLEWQKFTIDSTAKRRGLTPPTVTRQIQQGVGNMLRIDPQTDIIEFIKEQENE